jgi:peptide/nickel transport system substrate-binding protein
MWATNATSILPITYLEGWTSGVDGDNLPQKENDWVGGNISRWVSPEYDALFASFNDMRSIEEASDLLIQLNDMLIEDVAVIPMVIRAGDTYAISRSLVAENVAIGPGFELTYWNIANWNLQA